MVLFKKILRFQKFLYMNLKMLAKTNQHSKQEKMNCPLLRSEPQTLNLRADMLTIELCRFLSKQRDNSSRSIPMLV